MFLVRSRFLVFDHLQLSLSNLIIWIELCKLAICRIKLFFIIRVFRFLLQKVQFRLLWNFFSSLRKLNRFKRRIDLTNRRSLHRVFAEELLQQIDESLRVLWHRRNREIRINMAQPIVFERKLKIHH